MASLNYSPVSAHHPALMCADRSRILSGPVPVRSTPLLPLRQKHHQNPQASGRKAGHYQT